MNKDIKKFVKKHRIDYKYINGLEEGYIYQTKNINHIFSLYGIYKRPVVDNVNIMQIKGFERTPLMRNTIINALSQFYDSKLGEFHQRSLSLLDIPESQIMKKLNNSLNLDLFVLQKIDDDNYIIDENGRHRFLVLKTHFLNRVKNRDANSVFYKETLNQYTFKSYVKYPDYIKTYSAYLLKEVYKESIEFNILKNNLVIILNGEVTIMEDDELLNFVRSLNIELTTDIRYQMSIDKNFNEFINNKIMAKEKMK